ncbi:hypothetical protein K502DRAFT_324223 [Neoconidiobolus thromboides FSU 785]|nr:hypothetical protein K502DRAFT_324223 [Neoconidiobolus thromboides FSU 785]
MYVRAIGKAESGIKVSEEVFEKLVDGNESKFQVKWEKANDKKCNMMDKIGDGRKYKNRGMRERAKNEVDNDGNDVIVVHIQSKSLVKIKYMGIDDSESAGKDKDDKAMKLGLRNSKPEEGDNENNLIYQELPKISGIRNTRIDIKFIFDE